MATDTRLTSSYYAAKFRESKENAAPFIKPETVPLDYGRRFHPFPSDFKTYPFEIAVKWIWLDLVFNWYFWITLSAYICILLAITLAAAAVVKSDYIMGVFAGLFAFASIVLLFLRINAAQNENHRRAICYLYEKKEQATKIWSQFGESEQAYCKDVFYETSSFQGKFRVLRDGTVEVIPHALFESTESFLQTLVKFNEHDNTVSGRDLGSAQV